VSKKTAASDVVLGAARAVNLEIDGAIAQITLNRPDTYNAIDAGMTQGLAAAIADIESMPEVRVILLKGAGKGFCSGGDLAFFASRGESLRPTVDRMLRDGHRFLEALRSTRKLVVVSVHGVAAGAGLSLAVAGDFCIAASDATFVPGYAKLGVSPDLGGTANMTRAIGIRRAMRLYFLEERITAAEAERLGIVSRIVEPHLLAEETRRIARALAEIPLAAAQSTKSLLRQATTTPFAQQLEAELESFQACVHTATTQSELRRFADQAAETRRTRANPRSQACRS